MTQAAKPVARDEPNLASVRMLAGEFSRRVRSRFGHRLGRIRLYGSAVLGDWVPESDVDILITLDSVSPEDGDWIVREAFRMGIMEKGVLLQPLFMDEQEFVNLLGRERAFALDAEEKGIPL